MCGSRCAVHILAICLSICARRGVISMFSAVTSTDVLTQASVFFGYVAPLVVLSLGIGVAGRVISFFRRLF